MFNMPRRARWLAASLAGILLLVACARPVVEAPVPPAGTSAGNAQLQTGSTVLPTTGSTEFLPPAATTRPDYDIITLLPPDAIPSIDDPQFYDVLGAELEYEPEEMVLGVERNGDARAYPVGVLARHEIVNDTVGGEPLAVTY